MENAGYEKEAWILIFFFFCTERIDLLLNLPKNFQNVIYLNIYLFI